MLVQYLQSGPNIVFERLCHAFLLSTQFRLYLFFRDLADLNRLEDMAQAHMKLVQNLHENRLQKFIQPLENVVEMETEEKELESKCSARFLLSTWPTGGMIKSSDGQSKK